MNGRKLNPLTGGELNPRKVRDVRNDRWYQDNDDGTVTLVVLRGRDQLKFEGADDDQAAAGYDAYCMRDDLR
jgi:hypothetical protein